MSNAGREHWDRVYQTKAATEVSWYRAHLETSLGFIEQVALGPTSAIIDVGGGESSLVDDLLERGYADVTVLDISTAALATTRARLGENAQGVLWMRGDVTATDLPEKRFDIWHDRAVFHFLTDSAQRAAYVRQVVHSVRPGGHVIVGAFGPHGPHHCSGLDVVRYEADALHDVFGPRFKLLRDFYEVHRTPLGREQQFVWCLCRLEHE